MSTSFPGALDALTNPAATDGLTGHAAQHANANDAIEALEAKVGVDNSTDPASLDYRVATLESGGGGGIWGSITGALSDQTDLQAALNGKLSASATTDAIAEGSSNLYFTAARVRDAVLTGLSTATNAVIAATDSVLTAFGKLQAQISGHTSSTANPHSVTKTQVGLGNVDNTADLNKPVSTATQAALALKADLVSPAFTTPDIGVATGTSFNSITGLSSTTPVMDGTAAVGTGTTTARADHVHPTDTSRAPIASPSFTGTLTHSGDVVLSGSGKRITGDFSNTTIANRLMFQTSTVDKATLVGILPNGTGNVSGTVCYGTSDTLNNPYIASYIDPAAATVEVGKVGTGPHLPLIYRVGGAERMRVGVSGGITWLQNNAGSFAAGEWSRDNNWGTYYRGAAVGVYADVAFASNDASCVFAITSSAVAVVTPKPLGYGPGAGGTVTQATSKSTAVTLNKPTGRITMHNEAMAAGTTVKFTLLNSLSTSNKTATVNIVGNDASFGADYEVSVASVSNGGFDIKVKNVSGTTKSDPLLLQFNLHSGATH